MSTQTPPGLFNLMSTASKMAAAQRATDPVTVEKCLDMFESFANVFHVRPDYPVHAEATREADGSLTIRVTPAEPLSRK